MLVQEQGAGAAVGVHSVLAGIPSADPEATRGAGPEPTVEEVPQPVLVEMGDAAVDAAVLSVLVAEEGPAILARIAAEVDAGRPQGTAFVPAGRVEASLGRLCAASEAHVSGVMLGDPPVRHFALTTEGRTALLSPEILRGQRRALVAVIAAGLEHFDGHPPVDYRGALDAFAIGDVLVRAKIAFDKGDGTPFVPAIDAGDVSAFFRAVDPALADHVLAAVEALVAPLVGAQIVTSTPVHDSDPPVTIYALASASAVTFSRAGADAVVAALYPVPEPAITAAEVSAQIVEATRRAREEAEAASTGLRKLAEDLAAKLKTSEARTTLLEGWFAKHKLDADKVLAADGMRVDVSRGEIFDYEVEILLEGDAINDLLAEMARARARLNAIKEEGKAKKKAAEAEESTAQLVYDGLLSVAESAGNGKGVRRVVKKKAYREVRGGMLITLSADAHDYGVVLATEPLAASTQTAIPGTGATGPQWTPLASGKAAVSPEPGTLAHAQALGDKLREKGVPVSAVTTTRNGVPVITVTAPADLDAPQPPDPPRWTGPVELSQKGVLRMLEALFEATPTGILEKDVLSRLAAYANVEGTPALGKLVAKGVKAMVTKGTLSSGEGGESTLLWWAKHEDPREVAHRAKVQAMPEPTDRKVAPAPSSDVRPEDQRPEQAKKGRKQRGKGTAGSK